MDLKQYFIPKFQTTLTRPDVEIYWLKYTAQNNKDNDIGSNNSQNNMFYFFCF